MNPSIGYKGYARNRDPVPEGVPKEWWNEKFPSDLTKLIGMFWLPSLATISCLHILPTMPTIYVCNTLSAMYPIYWTRPFAGLPANKARA